MAASGSREILKTYEKIKNLGRYHKSTVDLAFHPFELELP